VEFKDWSHQADVITKLDYKEASVQSYTDGNKPSKELGPAQLFSSERKL
jgi:hypothetical protein